MTAWGDHSNSDPTVEACDRTRDERLDREAEKHPNHLFSEENRRRMIEAYPVERMPF